MRDATQHFVLLLFAVGFSRVGWLMAHYPGRAYRFFTLGIQPEHRFFVGFCKVCGWIFASVFALGTLIYLGLIVHDLLR